MRSWTAQIRRALRWLTFHPAGTQALLSGPPSLRSNPDSSEPVRSPYATWMPYASRVGARYGPKSRLHQRGDNVNQNSRSTSEFGTQRIARPKGTWVRWWSRLFGRGVSLPRNWDT